MNWTGVVSELDTVSVQSRAVRVCVSAERDTFLSNESLH